MMPGVFRLLLALSVSLSLTACPRLPIDPLRPSDAPTIAPVSKEAALARLQQELGAGYVRPGAVAELKRSIVLTLVTDGVVPAEIRWLDKEGRGAFTNDSAPGTTWRVVVDGDYLETISCVWRDTDLRVHQVSTTVEISNSLIKNSSARPILSVSPSKLFLTKAPSAAISAQLGLDVQRLAGRPEIRLFRADLGEDKGATLPLVWSSDNEALQVTPAKDNRTAIISPMLSAFSGKVTARLAEDATLKVEIPVEVRPLGVDLLPDALVSYLPQAGTQKVNVRMVYRSPWDGTELLSDSSGTGLRWVSEDPQRLQIGGDGQMRWIAPSGPAPVRVTVSTADASTKAVVLEVYGDEPAWRARQGLAPAKAAVEGMVADSDGKLLAGARIALSVDGGITRTVITDSAGRFRIDDITVGSSVLVRATLAGYSQMARQLVLSAATEKVDFAGVTALNAEGLAPLPVPVPVVTPTATPSPTPTPSATPTPGPTPTPSVSPGPGSPSPIITPAVSLAPLPVVTPVPPSLFDLAAFAGIGTAGFSGDSGAATVAGLNGAYGIATDSSGNAYIADTLNHRLRKVTSGGAISTVAGNGSANADTDGGGAIGAAIGSPFDVTVDGSGNVYFTDPLHRLVRKVAANGTLTTVAGNRSNGTPVNGGNATSAGLRSPYGIAVDGAGTVFFADAGNHSIYKVTSGGTITLVAGTGSAGFSGDGGTATAATLNWPQGLALDSAGNLFVVDWGNQRVRRIASNGTITTVAGNGDLGFSGDGGAATAASLSNPYGVAVDAQGRIAISDWGNERVRLVAADGTISTIAGNGAAGFAGEGGSGELGIMDGPAGVAFVGADVLVVDHHNHRVRRMHRR